MANKTLTFLDVSGDAVPILLIDNLDGTWSMSVITPSGSSDQVQGNVAHAIADAGNPVKIGGRAVAAEITKLTANNRSDLLTDLVGKLINLPYANPENQIKGYASATGTADTELIAAQAAGVKSYITTLIICNTSAVDSFVHIKDGTTIIATIPCQAGAGAIVTLPVPLKTTAATALQFAAGAAATTIYVTAFGYKGV